MSVKRWAAKVDSVQAEIIRGLESDGVQVYVIRQPCDLLCRFWSNALRRYLWQPLEVKTPHGKRNPKARLDKRQKDQLEFLAATRTPVVTTLAEARSALSACDQATSVSCTSRPTGASTSSVGAP